MFLKNIRISNFKAIKDAEIKFQKGFNIIIGDNGVGKTSILEAISVALGGFLVGIDNVNTRHFTKDDICFESEVLGQGSYNIKPIQIDSEVKLDDKEYKWTRKKSNKKSLKSTVEPRDICNKAAILLNDSSAVLPLLNYQSVDRMWSQKKEKNENIIKKDTFSRSAGYIDCLSQESNVKILLNWCRRMGQISWQEDQNITEYESVTNALAKFMSIMNDSAVSKVLYDKKQEELIYKEGDKILPIGYLSGGYQSLIWMVLEIACRMAVLNPSLLENTTSETTGIVLIDELELHLHPKWQWKVVEALKSTFPKVQFIVTSNSPIILASCKDERVISINSNADISYMKTSYGLQVNDVLVSCQDSNNIALDINKKLTEFYKYIESKKYDDASKILNYICNELGEDNPDVTRARVTLDLESIPLN